MLAGLGLLAMSAVVLLVGAELFAEHAESAGRRLGVTAVGVGVLLAGAEPEELLTAITAAGRDRPGIAVGDAIGANITMLTLALGLAAVLRPCRSAAGSAPTRSGPAWRERSQRSH